MAVYEHKVATLQETDIDITGHIQTVDSFSTHGGSCVCFLCQKPNSWGEVANVLGWSYFKSMVSLTQRLGFLSRFYNDVRVVHVGFLGGFSQVYGVKISRFLRAGSPFPDENFPPSLPWFWPRLAPAHGMRRKWPYWCCRRCNLWEGESWGRLKCHHKGEDKPTEDNGWLIYVGGLLWIIVILVRFVFKISTLCTIPCIFCEWLQPIVGLESLYLPSDRWSHGSQHFFWWRRSGRSSQNDRKNHLKIQGGCVWMGGMDRKTPCCFCSKTVFGKASPFTCGCKWDA